MLQSYQAVLIGNRLKWIGDVPEYENKRPIDVRVRFLEERVLPRDASRGREMAEILEQLAQSAPVVRIADPISWQREVRKDRSLPGRED
jgi:hypothetical protein